jgi:hypothetical protein
VSAYESGVAIPITNVAKEIYRLAMRGGHDIEDFSVVYEYLSNASDVATVDSSAPQRQFARRNLDRRGIGEKPWSPS